MPARKSTKSTRTGDHKRQSPKDSDPQTERLRPRTPDAKTSIPVSSLGTRTSILPCSRTVDGDTTMARDSPAPPSAEPAPGNVNVKMKRFMKSCETIDPSRQTLKKIEESVPQSTYRERCKSKGNPLLAWGEVNDLLTRGEKLPNKLENHLNTINIGRTLENKHRFPATCHCRIPRWKQRFHRGEYVAKDSTPPSRGRQLTSR